ncbi:MAG TPA: hypothetical protein VIU11_28835, partial [Nakamurella sp.]
EQISAAAHHAFAAAFTEAMDPVILVAVGAVLAAAVAVLFVLSTGASRAADPNGPDGSADQEPEAARTS